MLGIIDRIINGGVKVLDEVITTQEEKQEFYNELEAMRQRDRESARKMYEKDSSLQKVFAIVFLLMYMLMTLAMIYFIFLVSKGEQASQVLDVPEWGVAFLSTLFGAMSTKVSTITDFLFGGSQQQQDNERRKK